VKDCAHILIVDDDTQLDMGVPEIDGFEILKVLHTEVPHLRVIAVPGSLQGVLLNSAKLFGAASVLEKPVDPEVVVRTIRGLTHRSM
jgi:CheY-like chemotaxis protein